MDTRNLLLGVVVASTVYTTTAISSPLDRNSNSPLVKANVISELIGGVSRVIHNPECTINGTSKGQ